MTVRFQIPNPFPIPESTENSLSIKRLTGGDRKYIVRVLATMLSTYMQKITTTHCANVANSLLRKYSFLKESVGGPVFCVYLLVHAEFMGKFYLYKIPQCQPQRNDAPKPKRVKVDCEKHSYAALGECEDEVSYQTY